jgi:outer membrane protein W
MKSVFSILFALVLMLALSVSENQAQNKMSAGAQVGLAVPMGGLGDNHSVGFGFNGIFIYDLQPQIQLTGSIGYTSFGAKGDLPSGYDYSFSTVPFLVGARYYFIKSPSTINPYVGAEIGLFFSSASVTVPSFSYGGLFSYGGGETSVSSTDFGFVPAVGLQLPLSPKLNLDANLKVNLVSDATYLGINAGVVYAF